MRTLRQLFEENTGHLIDKWSNYFEVYESHLQRFRGKNPIVIEIGVYQGGSLRLWRDYFGPGCRIIGVDVNPACKVLETEGIEIYIGSQEDRHFLRDICTSIPNPDIVLDDGGHFMQQQIVSFEELFGHVKSDGVYICEDLHTSYWWEYGGGYRRKHTFIEYSKSLIDFLSAWHSRELKLFQPNNFTQTARSLHYYDSILVIEKKLMTAPIRLQSGKMMIGPYLPRNTFSQKMGHFLKNGYWWFRQHW